MEVSEWWLVKEVGLLTLVLWTVREISTSCFKHHQSPQCQVQLRPERGPTNHPQRSADSEAKN